MPENQATQRLAEILTRIAALPSKDLDPPQFFANYLQLTVACTGSEGGAIWLIQPDQLPQCYCHIELESSGINESEQQKQFIVETVQQTVKESKPIIVPAMNSQMNQEGELANRTAHPFVFKPLRAAGQVAMVLQLIARREINSEETQVVLSLLGQIAETAETYLAHRRAAVLEDDRKALAQLLQYTEGVHNSLDPVKVVYQLANMGRDAIGCERVVIWIDPTIRRSLQAVSGVDKPDSKAVLLKSLENLSRHCLEIKKPIVGSREQLPELPPDDKLTQLLTNYFNISQLNQIFLQPIKGQQDYLGVLAAEGFDEQKGVNLAGIIAAVSNHGAIALENALEMASVPLVRPFARLQKIRKDPKRRRKWLIASGLVLAALCIALLCPWTIRIDCACELVPTVSRVVDAPLDGIQLLRIRRSSGLVTAGEIIAELDDSKLTAQRASLQAARAQEQIKKTQLRGVEQRMSELELERIQNEIKLIDLQIEMCKVRSPIHATILTAQNDLEMLEGTIVKMGEPICELADLGNWQLRVDVPQEEIGWVQRGLKENQSSQVEFFLAAYPKNKLKATIVSENQISQLARLKENQANVFEIRLDVSNDQLNLIKLGLRPGSIGRAKIDTVSRPLGYVLLRKVIRFFRVTFF